MRTIYATLQISLHVTQSCGKVLDLLSLLLYDLNVTYT